MVERSAPIVNKLGIHARPAAEIVKTASRFKSNIVIIRDDLEVNAKSIMGVMMLAAAKGSTIVIETDGTDEVPAMQALVQLVADRFGEEE
jgi:phosphocarrier protein HPr